MITHNTHHCYVLPFFNRITQSDTPAQRQAPSRASEKRASQQWDKSPGTKDAIFTAGSHTRLIEYSNVVT